jgi:hypothetical protein
MHPPKIFVEKLFQVLIIPFLAEVLKIGKTAAPLSLLFCILITFNNHIKACFSNSIQTHTTKIEKNAFLISKTGFNSIFKDY